MCSVISYLLSALLFMSATADQQYQHQQWIPDFDTFQGMNLKDFAQDQQFQASDLLGGQAVGGYLDNYNHGFNEHGGKEQAYPIHQHIHEETPEPIKHYKEVVVPVPKNVEFKINQPVIIPVPHPIPIHIPVPKAVVVPVIKEVSVPVEKSVPYPVSKDVHVPKIKPVPFEVVKHVFVSVEKPVPFKVPVYETIIHTKKGSHKI